MPLQSGAHQVELDYFVRRGWGKTRVNFGIARPEDLVSDEAKTVAAKADVVVVAAGFNQAIEGESADRMFALPPGQDESDQPDRGRQQKHGCSGDLGRRRRYDCLGGSRPALLQAWFPGQEGGTALAQLLFGDYSPSGKLPITLDRRWEDNPAHDTYYPKSGDKKVVYSEGIFVGYRGYDKAGVKPLFPFGYGLSYTKFAYKNLTVSPASASVGEPVEVHFEVTNTGSKPGAEVAEVYVGDRHSSVARPAKELKGFVKINLEPGESKQVSVPLNRRSFSYYDVKKHAWSIEPGDFDVFVGSSSANIELTGKLVIH